MQNKKEKKKKHKKKIKKQEKGEKETIGSNTETGCGVRRRWPWEGEAADKAEDFSRYARVRCEKMKSKGDK